MGKKVTHLSSSWISDSLVEFFALKHKEVIIDFEDATLCRNWTSCVHVVTCDHAYTDTSM